MHSLNGCLIKNDIYPPPPPPYERKNRTPNISHITIIAQTHMSFTDN